MKRLPDFVADMRAANCRQRGCKAEGLDYGDPCGKCPEGHFGPTSFECRSAKTPCPGVVVMPSPLAMGRNLAKATSEEAAAVMRGVAPVSGEEARRRLAICKSNECGQFDAKSERCAACGCWMAHKTAWRSQSCPKGLW